MKVCTLLFLRRDDQILLAMKKRGFGAHRWNGVGGKVEIGESIEAAMIRETQEEIGVTPRTYHEVATHDFQFPDGTTDMQVYTFVCTAWDGEPIETEEMAPQWFNVSDIPYDRMWQDDQYWLPQVLAGQKLQTNFRFNEQEQLIGQTVEVVT